MSILFIENESENNKDNMRFIVGIHHKSYKQYKKFVDIIKSLNVIYIQKFKREYDNMLWFDCEIKYKEKSSVSIIKRKDIVNVVETIANNLNFYIVKKDK